MVQGHVSHELKPHPFFSVIVKMLLKEGPAINPARVEAAGHGEYAPKKPNTSAANKAANRRTEIILTPHLEDIMQMVVPQR